MAWPAEVARPPDASGGILVLGYNVGAREHHARFHIQAFLRDSLHDTAGNPDYNYADSESFVGITFSTTELSIQETATNLIAKLKPYYKNTTLFNIAALYQIVDGAPVPVFPAPSLGDEVGTGDFTIAADDPENFIGTHFTTRTREGGRSGVLLVGAAKRQMQQRAFVTGTGGGLAAMH